jgi:hypothetical protein
MNREEGIAYNNALKLVETKLRELYPDTDGNIPEKINELEEFIFGEKRILNFMENIDKKKNCKHENLHSGSGGFYIFCNDCTCKSCLKQKHSDYPKK